MTSRDLTIVPEISMRSPATFLDFSHLINIFLRCNYLTLINYLLKAHFLTCSSIWKRNPIAWGMQKGGGGLNPNLYSAIRHDPPPVWDWQSVTGVIDCKAFCHPSPHKWQTDQCQINTFLRWTKCKCNLAAKWSILQRPTKCTCSQTWVGHLQTEKTQSTDWSIEQESGLESMGWRFYCSD